MVDSENPRLDVAVLSNESTGTIIKHLKNNFVEQFIDILPNDHEITPEFKKSLEKARDKLDDLWKNYKAPKILVQEILSDFRKIKDFATLSLKTIVVDIEDAKKQISKIEDVLDEMSKKCRKLEGTTTSDFDDNRKVVNKFYNGIAEGTNEKQKLLDKSKAKELRAEIEKAKAEHDEINDRFFKYKQEFKEHENKLILLNNDIQSLTTKRNEMEERKKELIKKHKLKLTEYDEYDYSAILKDRTKEKERIGKDELKRIDEVDKLIKAKYTEISNLSSDLRAFKYIFAIDTSGSMSGTRWKFARESFNKFIEILKDANCNASVTLIYFDTHTSIKFTNRSINEKIEFTDIDPCGGGTNYEPLTKTIFELCSTFGSNITPIVTIITDGEPTDTYVWSTTLANAQAFHDKYKTKGGKLFIIDVGEHSSLKYIFELTQKANGQTYYEASRSKVQCAIRAREDSLVEEISKIAKWEKIRYFEMKDDIALIEAKASSDSEMYKKKLALVNSMNTNDQDAKVAWEKQKKDFNSEMDLCHSKIDNEMERISIAIANMTKEKCQVETLKLKAENILDSYKKVLEQAYNRYETANNEFKRFDTEMLERTKKMEKQIATQFICEDHERIMSLKEGIQKFIKNSDNFIDSTTSLSIYIKQLIDSTKLFAERMQVAFRQWPAFRDKDLFKMFTKFFSQEGPNFTKLLYSDAITKILINNGGNEADVKRLIYVLDSMGSTRDIIIQISSGDGTEQFNSRQKIEAAIKKTNDGETQTGETKEISTGMEAYKLLKRLIQQVHVENENMYMLFMNILGDAKHLLMEIVVPGVEILKKIHESWSTNS